MHERWRGAGRDHHVEGGAEITKHTVDGVPIQPAAAPDGKERRVGAERRAPVAAHLEVPFEELADTGSDRDEAVLAEFGLTNQQDVAGAIEISRIQTADLADAETERVQHDED